jgi:hypothetical protein
MKQVTIIAGGWSATRVDLRRVPGFVIAVNDAAVYAPRWDAAVSMDRLWFENRHEQVLKSGKPLYMRENAIRSRGEHAAVERFACDHASTTMAEKSDVLRLNGTHSGFCALNLAYQMLPEEIFLIGFDMQLGPRGERHWFRDYPWSNGGGSGAGKLGEWAAQFKTAGAQMRKARISVNLVESSLKVPGWANVGRGYLDNACAA